MPKPIPVARRRQIVERRQGGERLKGIATDLEMPYDSVRKVWQVYRREGRIQANYQACGSREVKASRRVYRGALWLKRQHPRWGAPLICQVIREKWTEEEVPHERTLQRWFRRAGLSAGRKPKVEGQARLGRGKVAHNIWEMDSREAISMANGEKVSWLLVSDEASGAILGGEVFPLPTCQSDHGG